MKTEIIKNPNGTYAVYSGNILIDDMIKRREDAEIVAKTGVKL